jgi:hypothetical protein
MASSIRLDFEREPIALPDGLPLTPFGKGLPRGIAAIPLQEQRSVQ